MRKIFIVLLVALLLITFDVKPKIDYYEDSSLIIGISLCMPYGTCYNSASAQVSSLCAIATNDLVPSEPTCYSAYMPVITR